MERSSSKISNRAQQGGKIGAGKRQRRAARELATRYAVLVAGLFLLSFGVALSTKANLGVSPISCVPYVISLCPGVAWSMGGVTVAMHVVFILAQVALLRKNFELIQLLQLGVAVVFGVFTDFSLFLVSGIAPESYAFSAVLCCLSFVFIAFGVFLEVKADVVMLAGEGVMLAIARVFKIEFGKVKIAFDCALVLAGTAISLCALHGVEGVREGTVAAAVLVGLIVRLFSRYFRALDRVLPSREGEKTVPAKNAPPPAYAPDCPFVITIAREYGSGGHAVGEILASRLGIKFYDGALIRLTAAQSGFTREYIRHNEQKLIHRFLYELYAQNYAYKPGELPPRDALFLAQSKVIRDIAAKRACVIVGRCSNFILKGRPNTFNVFLHANRADRRERIIKNYGVAPEDAEAELDRMDTERRNHCLYYTGEDWAQTKNYDISLDSSRLGLSATADSILAAAGKTVPADR